MFEASTRQSPFVRNEAGCPAKNCGASALKTPSCTCGTPGDVVDARQDMANQTMHSIGPAASRCREPLKHDASLEEGAMASNGGHRVCCPPASSLVCYLALIGSTSSSIDAWCEVLGGLRTTYQETVQLANGVKRFILSHSPGYLDSSSPPHHPQPRLCTSTAACLAATLWSSSCLESFWSNTSPLGVASLLRVVLVSITFVSGSLSPRSYPSHRAVL